MTNTKVGICTSALLLIGADEITSFTDSTREAKLCSTIYGTTRDDLLQSHPWRFSINQVELNQLVGTPLYNYAYAYQLPAGYLRLIGKENPGTIHEIHEDKLYCNASPLRVTYQFTPDESKFPPYFVRLLELELAKLMSVAMLEDEQKAFLFDRLIRKQLAKARTVDSQSHGNHRMPESNFSYTSVRY